MADILRDKVEDYWVLMDWKTRLYMFVMITRKPELKLNKMGIPV